MPNHADNLTPKQRRFVEAYAGAANGNATEAARLAGYTGSDTALAVSGSRLLRTAKIASAIDALVGKAERRREKRAIATVEEVRALLTAIMQDEAVEPKDRINAADKLLKSGGAYLERREVKHEGLSVQVYVPDNRRDRGE